MAYSVSNNFKTSIKDATKPKRCIILFDDAFFASEDFTDDATIQQYFNTSEDLTFGDCPSDSLSFSIISNGKLVGYSFGRAKVYFGTMTAFVNYSMGSNLAHIEIGNVSYNATENGLYRGSTKIDDGRYVSLVSDGTTVYAVGPDGAVKVVNATSAVSKYVPTAFMAEKLLTPTSAVFSGSTATVWTDGTKYTYEYVPMGEYNVEKPRSTVGAVVQISDAYDDMTKFDKDASDFVSAITYPITLGELFEDLCEYCGVSYVTSTFPNSNLSMTSSLFSNSSFNCRQILSWIAEKAYRVAHMNRTGQLELVWLSNDVESLTASDVMTDGYSVSEYVTQAVDSVLLKAQNGSSVTYGDTSNNPYPITGNPFINTITAQDLAQYKAIPTYVPIAMAVFEADPSVDIGDRIDFEKIALDYVALSDIFANVYADVDRTLLLQQYGEVYQYPLMNRTIVFNGGLKATYEATGNQKRAYDARYTEYNALISVNESQLNGAVDEAKLYSDEELNAFKNGTYAQFVIQTATNISNAQAAAEQTASDALQSFIGGQYATDLADLQSQIDGQIETYFDNYIPTLNNLPASQWTTTTDKDNHLGDLFYVVDNPDHGGETYRFVFTNNEYKWSLVEDSAVASAIQQAQEAYALAGSKKRVFTSQPTPPYDVGDLWVNGNDFYYCRTAQASGSYVASHWTTATGYTKTTTYYQSSFPSNPYTGDLCIRTDMGNSLYRYDGTAWSNVQDTDIQTALTNAATAQATADGKIMTYAQATAPADNPQGTLDEGDLWIDTDDNNKLYRWSGSSWAQYTDNSAVVAYDRSLNQQAVFNKLTQNQTIEGMFMDPETGNIYVNASYVQSGTLSGVKIIGGNGTTVIDENGKVTITGGDNSTPNFKVKTGSGDSYTMITPSGFSVINSNYHSRWLGATLLAQVASDTIFGGAGALALAPSGLRMAGGYGTLAQTPFYQVELDYIDGLVFRDSSGNLTASYPAKYQGLSVATAGYNGSGWIFKIECGSQYLNRPTFAIIMGHQAGGGYTRMIVCTATTTGTTSSGTVSSVAISYYQPYQNAGSVTASFSPSTQTLNVNTANGWCTAMAIYDSRYLHVRAVT